MTLEEAKEKLVYRYLRGSWSHGIAIEGKSDYDYGGVYISPFRRLLGLRTYYNQIEQTSDERSDETYYELGRWLELLLKSNPSALESLYIDKEFIIGDIHPAVQSILDNRGMFLTRQCFNPIIGYAFEQIKKAQGYNKKCMYPDDMQRKGILDFCYTFNKQGSMPFKDWLQARGMKHEYCGLVNVPNMFEMYSVFYDWGTHIQNEGESPLITGMFAETPEGYAYLRKGHSMGEIEPIGYRGIVGNELDANSVRLSSVKKDETPICHMQFSKDGYISHCRIYKEWVEWKKNRNEIRYSDNKGYNYDAKNMCECMRLLHMGIEIASGAGFNVKRTWDREYLLDIKAHKYTYDELMLAAEDSLQKFKELSLTSNLPERIDPEAVNDLLIDIRKDIYKGYL